MSIEYTYTIINVDEAARCMEVVYSSEGRQTMHIGARLPYASEQFEDVIRVFAPVRLWEEAAMQVVVPEIGTSGRIVIAPAEIAPQPGQPIQIGIKDI